MYTFHHIARYIAIAMSLLLLTGCEKEIELDVKPAPIQLVVEGYINNLMPEYNYVLLSRTQNFFTPNFAGTPVRNAIVTITEGNLQADESVVWDPASRTTLRELSLPLLPASFSSGAYFDPRLLTNPSQSLIGRPGKAYLLEIEADGQRYSATTQLLTPVTVDSITGGFPFTEDDSIPKLRITNHYQDPDSIGNRQQYYWRFRDNRTTFGWGALSRSRAPGRDDLVNGEYIRLTHPQGFLRGDTINYYMASVTAEIWNFWDSYNKVRDNNGPFSTPVNLGSTIKGNDVIGCFSGFSLSTKTIILPR
jgi:hypothetical protein